MISKVLADIGADGINGDTLPGFRRAYRAASDRLNHPLALEPELGIGAETLNSPNYPSGSDEMLGYNVMSWAYWNYNFVPSVSRNKWFEPRHMIHVC